MTFFCQANAAFYAGLTESESAFKGIIETFRNEEFFYTLDKLVWLELLRRLATKTSETERSRQSVRLLQTTARLHRELGFAEESQALEASASKLEEEINQTR